MVAPIPPPPTPANQPDYGRAWPMPRAVRDDHDFAFMIGLAFGIALGVVIAALLMGWLS